MLPEYRGYLAIALALAGTLTLTPVVRTLARRGGMMTKPRTDRWAKKPTALLGGIALFAATACACLLLLPDVAGGGVVLGASASLFMLGLLDDLRPLKPYQKLIGQIMASVLVVLAGHTLPWTSSPLLNMALTLFWLVGITNAVNLLDNMDGLAAGVAAIAAGCLSAVFFTNGQPAEGFLLAAFAAALVGFLVYNFNPASIFMGDCGSLFIGFFLASTALLHLSEGGRSRSLLAVLAVPVLLLFIPIFDTTLVTVMRKLAGRAASQGGRDHTSHRLVALGLSERRAVGLLYGLALLSGMLALCLRQSRTDISLGMIAAFTLALTILGAYLARVQVYEEGTLPDGKQPLVAFLVDVSYKRRLFEVFLDVALIGLSYYTANLLFYGSLDESLIWTMLLKTLPVLVFLKLAVFLTTGVYRGLWQYVGLTDLFVHVKAVGLSSAVVLLVVLFLFRFQGFSRVVFVLDGLLLLVLVCGSRLAFRFLGSLIPEHARTGRRALIYGAGDGGELLLRELHNNRTLGCLPVGFADDDPNKAGKMIHGLRVFGGNGSFTKICEQQRVDVVFLSSARFSEERVREITQQCEKLHLDLQRLRIVLEPLVTGDDP